MADQLLKVENLSAGYGEAVVLSGVNLSLGEGQTLALLGRTGTGKTTLMDTLAGATRQHAGSITLGGKLLHTLPSHARAAAGIGWVPQERNIFKSLTVHENLTAVARPQAAGSGKVWTPERVYEMFPRLAERKANMGNQLSGGEQQMLAIGRALMTNPHLLILDEATEGLAPVIRAEIWATLAALKARGQAILVIDKNLAALGRLADRHYVLERGRTVWAGSGADLIRDAEQVKGWIGV